MNERNMADIHRRDAHKRIWPAVHFGLLLLFLAVLVVACSGSQEQVGEAETARADVQAQSPDMTATAAELATSEAQQAEETATAEFVAASTEEAQLTAESRATIDGQATMDAQATREAERQVTAAAESTAHAEATAEAERQATVAAEATVQAEITAEAASGATATAAFAATATMAALPPTPEPTSTLPPATMPPLPTATPAERVLGVGTGLLTLTNTTTDRPLSVGNVPCDGYDGTVHEGETVECEIPSGSYNFWVNGWDCVRNAPRTDLYDGMHVAITIYRVEGRCEWYYTYCLDGVCEDMVPNTTRGW